MKATLPACLPGLIRGSSNSDTHLHHFELSHHVSRANQPEPNPLVQRLDRYMRANPHTALSTDLPPGERHSLLDRQLRHDFGICHQAASCAIPSHLDFPGKLSEKYNFSGVIAAIVSPVAGVEHGLRESTVRPPGSP